MGDPVPKKNNEQDVKDALVPVVMGAPKAPAPKDAATVVDNRVPTVGDVLDPRRPSLAGEDSKTLIAIVEKLVEDLYNQVLFRELDELKPTLDEVPVPADDAKWVLKVIAFAVELTATLTLGKVGGIAASKLFGAAEEVEASAMGTMMQKAGEEIGKAAGKKLGAEADERLAPEPASADDAHATEHGPNMSPTNRLVDEYVEQQRAHLVAKKHDAVSRLMLLGQRSAQVNSTDVANLDEQLRSVIDSGVLRDWFRQRIALEWMNVLARISLGRRPKGQTTNLIGANVSGGFHEAGARATKQWRGGDGFVDIVVHVGDDGALSVDGVTATGRPGVAKILKDIGAQYDADGRRYTLGSMPAFRRIWLATGPTKLDTNPAFAITPEGAVEMNYDDPALARLGGATLDHSATAFDPYDGRDGKQRDQRAVRATHAMIGAQKVMMVLAVSDTEKMK